MSFSSLWQAPSNLASRCPNCGGEMQTTYCTDCKYTDPAYRTRITKSRAQKVPKKKVFSW